MTKAGQDWGSGRPRHPQAKIAAALSLRAKGMKLKDVAKKTGLHISYISRLTSFLEKGVGRADEGLKAVKLSLLKKRAEELVKNLADVRRQIRLLSGVDNGKSGNPEKGDVGPEGEVTTTLTPGGVVRQVRPTAGESRRAANRPCERKDLEGK